MRPVNVIDTELGRLLKAKSQLSMDFNNKVSDLTQEAYEARMTEISTKIDKLQDERKESEKATKQRFDLK